MSDSPKKRPNQVGIKAFTDNTQDYPEIDSPMRRKKKNLGSLELKPTVAEKIEDKSTPETQAFATYEILFQEVLKNFEKK
jgi:hypothetical protein